MRSRVAAIVVTALLAARTAGAQQKPDLAQYVMADRAAEIALARTAAPKHVSDSAKVLVLTRTGFVEAVKGTNGFTCFVLHSWDAKLDDPNFWNPKFIAPHCINAAASRTVLGDMKKRTEWIMAGVSPKEVVARTKRAYAAHELHAPAPGAMAFMLSQEQVLATENPHWVPHVMFYFPMSTPAASFGVGGTPATTIDASEGDPDAMYRTLLVPVRRWSDGTLALPAAGH